MDSHPDSTLVLSVCLVMGFYTLDAVDSIHAARTTNDSPLTIFFDSMCSSVGTVFIALILCTAMDITQLDMVWACVQIGQLVLLNVHIDGLAKNLIRYFLFTGPGECVSLFVSLLLFRAVFGLNLMLDLAHYAVLTTHNFLSYFHPFFQNTSQHLTADVVIYSVYVGIVGFTLLRLWMMPAAHKSTRNGVALCLLIRLFVSVMQRSVLHYPVTLPDVVSDGLFLAMISSDVLLAKMAQRTLHSWLPIFALVSFFSDFILLLTVAFYYVKVLAEIQSYTKLPILSINRNVYCDGVYDLCHLGHMNVYKKALAHGTRLFVGVCADEDVSTYKRAPYMTTEEREAVVSACKYVFKVISHAPCKKGSLSEEFIHKHNIHIVVCSEEYDSPDDEWYAAPRKMGILRPLPRTSGVSTSDLVRRIQSRYVSEGKDAPKDAAARELKNQK